jgi:hypothetical protein
MATYKVLYWQEIPSQIKAEDDLDDVTLPMPDADAYLAQWKWSEEEDREGSAEDVAEAVKAELEAKADW